MTLSELSFTNLCEGIDLTTFDCEDDDLNEFLHKDCFGYENELRAKTYLFYTRSPENVIAFFSISNDVINDKGNPSRWKQVLKGLGIPHEERRNEYPAVKIGRLGVNTSHQAAGLGTDILNVIIGLIINHSKSACRFIVVDAYNNSRTLNFYTKNGFQFLLGDKDKDSITRIMILDLLPFFKAMDDD